ncbi:LuxR C-terminal-related transcriptional regulator [Amantichitinum ursilacus]|uniref:LuxR C-terminal-related transcriptional regulator n=1 Tax=Amantichitinum ursilacus TaxID=857265 RepID=UPI001379181B|nr:helix-turn-helix transcriptional regulator [Amantichitinum ursilacus]
MGAAALCFYPALAALTPRERQVALHILRGDHTKTIARALGISVGTARKHRENLMRKLGVNHAGQLAAKVAQWPLA